MENMLNIEVKNGLIVATSQNSTLCVYDRNDGTVVPVRFAGNFSLFAPLLNAIKLFTNAKSIESAYIVEHLPDANN